MLTAIARLFRPAKPAPAPFVWDIPAHKGFNVVIRHDGAQTIVWHFDTLPEARRALDQANRNRAEFVAKLKARWGSYKPARRQAYIQNLETGRFA